MHLTTKQISVLLIPFLISAMVYIFDFDIVKNIKYLFPSYEEYTNKSLDKKATIYLKIESKDKLYQEIQENIKKRPQNAKWIVEKVFYKKLPKKSIEVINNKKTHGKKNFKEKELVWNLEAVFSKDKVAIINGIVVKEKHLVDGAEVLKILDDRVLLSYKKGKKWIYLFH